MKLEQKIPPVVVFFIVVILMWVTTKVAGFLSVYHPFKIQSLILCVLLGVGFALLGVTSFKKHKTSVNPIKTDRVVSLVTSGVYQYSRNPMYVGMLLCLVGIGLYTSNPLNILFIVLFVWYMNKYQITPEEAFLTDKFGASYIEYMKTVRRWL
ncbi:methyltransferase family protein [Alteromonas stellipolaris]|uniref:methyltransferase family protein n=1 Tax=Alteromonas stellipolaris TaxID=233316 RepID=UPI0026E1BD62|nr:isoprenylcysteine carboxylmethyltransferase family protein [Alteromonas stellipolaris]MDO6535435.1 isoprenylcysteine carboxylmethyltransferase family protein [Alteromonas stellipolaris]MDO6627311.1 isoprenylcysteine carboxylmethyltransferase family protein [Alteromonas stellipolaris]